jgi:hypothetical protein
MSDSPAFLPTIRAQSLYEQQSHWPFAAHHSGFDSHVPFDSRYHDQIQCIESSQAYKAAFEELNKDVAKPAQQLSGAEAASAKMLAGLAISYEKLFGAKENSTIALTGVSIDEQRDKDSESMKVLLAKQSTDQTDALIAQADQLLLDSPYKIIRAGSQVLLGSKDSEWMGIQNPEHLYHTSILLKGPTPLELCEPR